MSSDGKTYLSWTDVYKRAEHTASELERLFPGQREVKLYGVPRGGVYAAQAVRGARYLPRSMLFELVTQPGEADVFVDDLIDSGATRDRFQSEYNKPFFVLLDKRIEGRQWWVFPWEDVVSENGPQENIRRLIEYIGDDPLREGLRETPERVVRSYRELYAGYGADELLVFKTFEDGACDEMVVLRDIEFYSTCEHHMLPFFGKAHIAYIPHGRIIGASKLVRLLDVYSRRLQVQERLCEQVTIALDKHLNPLGSACVLEAQHFCMTSRGVQRQHSVMVTSSLTGVFRQPSNEARQEFLSMIRG